MKMSPEETALSFAKYCMGWADASQIAIEYTDAVVIKRKSNNYFHPSNLTEVFSAVMAYLTKHDHTLVTTFRKEPPVEGKPGDWTVQIDGEYEVEGDDLGKALMECCIQAAKKQ